MMLVFLQDRHISTRYICCVNIQYWDPYLMLNLWPKYQTSHSDQVVNNDCLKRARSSYLMQHFNHQTNRQVKQKLERYADNCKATKESPEVPHTNRRLNPLTWVAVSLSNYWQKTEYSHRFLCRQYLQKCRETVLALCLLQKISGKRANMRNVVWHSAVIGNQWPLQRHIHTSH